MTRKRWILLLLIGFLVVCPLVTAFLLATVGHPPRISPPLTPIVSPTIFFVFTPPPDPPTATTPSPFVPIFATHAAIETQYAGTAVALTPAPH